MIKQKKREKIGKDQKNNYHIWSSGKLFSLILIAISFLFFILSIVKIPFLSTIPGYTFGFFFGNYSFIFYFLLIYYATCKLFNINIFLIKMISKIKVLNYSWLNFFILIFGVILIIETSIYMIDNKSPFPGIEAWNNNFNSWWESFTSLNNALEPNINNSGVIIALFLSILYSIGGTIISIIFSILLIFYFVFYLFFSSPIKKIEARKEIIRKNKKENNEYETKIVDLSFEDNHKIVVSDFGTKIIENIDEHNPFLDNSDIEIKKSKKKEFIDDINEDETVIDTVPFDNPFEDPESFISNEKVTQEIKVGKSKDGKIDETKFIFNNQEIIDNKKTNHKAPSIYNQTSKIRLSKNIENIKSKKKYKQKKKEVKSND